MAKPFDVTNSEIHHVFCNVSQKSYGACVSKVRVEDGSTQSRLISGKCRFAPLKDQSICRLVLMGH